MERYGIVESIAISAFLFAVLMVTIAVAGRYLNYKYLFFRSKFFRRATGVIVSKTPVYSRHGDGESYLIGVDVHLEGERFLSELIASSLMEASRVGDNITVWCSKESRESVYSEDYYIGAFFVISIVSVPLVFFIRFVWRVIDLIALR